MVKLNRIYTRTGDAGTTGLGTGVRVRKTHIRVEAYGTVDEANAALGVAIVECERQGSGVRAIGEALQRCQHDMFDVGADLCTPIDGPEAAGTKLRVVPAQTERLERLIDEHNERLGTLTSFVLPGGSPPSAALHVARTVVRRAERLVVALLDAEPAATNPETLKYLNRLSDLLFVLARAANEDGKLDVLWVPGANRSG